MALFAVKTDRSDAVADWFNETTSRARESNMLKNPFNIRVKRIFRRTYWVLVLEVSPVYPNLSIFGWMTAVGIVMLWGWTWWLLPAVFIGCLGVFWTSEFYFLVTKMGLRKAGYKGPVKRLRFADVIKEVIW